MLRHAWLSQRDKRITAGRNNQVHSCACMQKEREERKRERAEGGRKRGGGGRPGQKEETGVRRPGAKTST